MVKFVDRKYFVDEYFHVVNQDVSVVDQDSAASGHVNCSINHPSVFTLQHSYVT